MFDFYVWLELRGLIVLLSARLLSARLLGAHKTMPLERLGLDIPKAQHWNLVKCDYCFKYCSVALTLASSLAFSNSGDPIGPSVLSQLCYARNCTMP